VLLAQLRKMSAAVRSQETAGENQHYVLCTCAVRQANCAACDVS
jgi:hypothetical protein